MRPLIGVAPDLDDERGATVERPYLDALYQAGGEPKITPTLEAARTCGPSGLLLCGGWFDIPPERYRQSPKARLDPPRELRTHLEHALLEEAERTAVPVLGICNGAQLMAVFRGGTLVQDLVTLWPGALEHERSDMRERAVHPVELSPDSRLAGFLGQTSIEVNSTHHQAIDRPGEGVRDVGRAPDGVIEAIEDPAHPFWIGVQWHPERLAVAHSARIFEVFVDAARRHAAHR
jgi:putative glutamine amidotransferase